MNDFLTHFKIHNSRVETFDITAQLTLKKLKTHNTDSRPDMAIFLEKKIIFFENKVNSKEGYKQLKRYAEHLENITNEKKTLVYITKHFDLKDSKQIFKDCTSKINFIQIRWYKIYRFFRKYKSDPIIFELLVFMKQNKLSMNNQFNPADIITLTNFTNVRRMMDESLYGAVSKKFKLINKGVSKKSTAMTQLREHDRYIYYKNHKEKLWIGLGYWMNSSNDKEYPDVGIVVEVAPQSAVREKITVAFKNITANNPNWTGYNLSNPKAWCGITYSKSLQTFLADGSQIEKIKTFFLDGLDELEVILNKNTDLPRN